MWDLETFCAITVAGRVLKERWTPQTYTKFANLTRCVVACTQKTLTDRCINKQNCTSSKRIPHDPQVNTGLLWITHRNYVTSLTRMVRRAQRLLQSSGRVPLVQPFISMTSYKVSQPMCAVTVFYMFFLRASDASPQCCFALLRKLGRSTHVRDHCVREMSVSFFGFM